MFLDVVHGVVSIRVFKSSSTILLIT
jgi:hypothetical protein